MTYTENYNLQIQPHGQQGWDTPLNSNFSIIDGQIKARANEIGNINLLNTEDKSSTVNAINSHLIDYVRQPGYGIATGNANTYAITLNPAPTEYVDGMGIYVKINITNTGASTINVNGLGAIPVKDSLGNDVVAGALKENVIYGFRYESISGNFIYASNSADIVGDALPEDLLANKTATTLAGQITGTMPIKSGITYTPTTTDQTISIGYEDGTCKVKGDVNLISANLKANTSCFGVTGKSTVVDTEDATALVSQLLAGVSAYVNGVKLIGSMVNNGAVVIQPGTSNIPIAKGYHDGNGYVKGDANLITAGENIVYHDTTVVSTVNQGDVYVLAKSATVLRAGTVRVKFTLQDQSGYNTVYGRVYKNGVAVGTERIVSNSTPVTFVEDFAVNANDVIQIYHKAPSGSFSSYITSFLLAVSETPFINIS